MTLRLFLSPRFKTAALVTAAVMAAPLLYHLGKALSSVDPFAKYAGSGYADPFGGNIGSFMENVRVEVYEGQDMTVGFNAHRLDIRRDRQFMNISLITDGVVFEKGNKEAAFEAGLAVYDVSKDRVEVSGGAKLFTDLYALASEGLSIDTNAQKITIPTQVSGRYQQGDISAASLLIDYGNRSSAATGVAYRGPLNVQQIGSRRDVFIRSETVEMESNPDRQIYHNAEGADAESMFRARKIVWEKDTDVITLEGECEYYSRDSVLSAPKIVIDRKARKAIATGAVRLLVKPEREKGVPSGGLAVAPAQPVLPPGLQQPSGRQQQREIDDELRSGRNMRKYPIVVTCTRVEYSYAQGSRMAVMTGSPSARQEMRAGSWREISAPRAVYDEEKEILTLHSNDGGRDVKMKNSVGDEHTAEWIEISTVEGNERLRGRHMAGVYKVNEDDELPGRRTPPPGGDG